MANFLTPCIGLFNKDRLEDLKESVQSPFDAQSEQLFDLLSSARTSVWGQMYDFDSIHSYDDFRERVPVQQYSDILPFVQRMMAGEENLLWPGQNRYFIPVSDTTSKGHLLPVSRQMLVDNFSTGIADSMAVYLDLKKENSQLFDGCSLWIDADRNDLVYRNLSHILLKELPFALKVFVRPQDPENGDSTEAELAFLCEEAQKTSVTSIHGRPRRYFDFLHYINKEKGIKDIRELCPDVEVFFHRGMPELHQLENAPVQGMDYHASFCTPEGYFGFQDQLGEPAMLLRTDAGVFYEFLPENKSLDKDNVIPLEEVRLNVRYRMILSTASGLWRYCSEGPWISFVSNHPYKFILL